MALRIAQRFDGAPVDALAPQRRNAPAIKPHSFPRFTQEVLHRIQAAAEEWRSASGDFGWQVVEAMWGLTAEGLDHAALSYLEMKPQQLQQHVLLTLATTNVANVKNLSAFVSCLIHDLDSSMPVCLGFLAGCCPDAHACAFLHPEEKPGWQLLWRRWQVTWQDFDYLVLNSLCQRPEAQQDQILRQMSNMKLRNIHNLSALLSSVIRRFQRRDHLGSRVEPEDVPASFEDEDEGESDGSAAAAKPGSARGSEAVTSEADTLDSSVLSSIDRGDRSGSEPLSEERSRTPLSITESGHSGPLNWADELEAEIAAGLLPEFEPAPKSAPPTPPVTSPTARRRPRAPAPLSPPQAAIGPQDFRQRTTSYLTGDVLDVVQRSTLPPPAAGWEALQALWRVGPAQFAPALLARLEERPPLAQEHILLTLAAADLAAVPDLSALLRTGLRAPERPVCWQYLAGQCPHEGHCGFPHLQFTPAWGMLYHHWGLTFMQFEFGALNALLQLPAHHQECLLTTLCYQPLDAVPSPSLLLLDLMRGGQ